MNLDRSNYDERDLSQLIVKPLFFGLGVNIVIPVALLMVCYYLTNNSMIDNKLGDFANILFFIFGAIAVFGAVFSLWWYRKIVKRPMIRKVETFDDDFSSELVKRCRPVFLLIASIALLGITYFFLTGRFYETVVFVVFSFVVFQVVRPRFGSMRKLLKHQEKLVKEGKFLID